jgi:hypothetical protein
LRSIPFCVGLLLLVPSLGCQQERVSQYVPPDIPKYDGPDVPDRSVWRPFLTNRLRPQALDDVRGTGFAVGVPGEKQPLLVTAMHLIDPSLGLIESAEKATELQAEITEATVTEAYGVEDQFRVVGGVRPLASQRRTEEATKKSLTNELLVFDGGPSAKRMRPLSFSETPAAVGDRIWLATAAYGGASPSVVAHQAVVEELRDDGGLLYSFTNEALSLQAADGAPLLNEQGKVIGMHLREQSAEANVQGLGLALSGLELE